MLTSKPTLSSMRSAVRALQADGADGLEIARQLARVYPTATPEQRRRALTGR